MNDFRCGNCKRLLAKIDGKSRVEIVCPKCKSMNVISEVFNMNDFDMSKMDLGVPIKVVNKKLAYIQITEDKSVSPSNWEIKPNN